MVGLGLDALEWCSIASIAPYGAALDLMQVALDSEKVIAALNPWLAKVVPIGFQKR